MFVLPEQYFQLKKSSLEAGSRTYDPPLPVTLEWLRVLCSLNVLRTCNEKTQKAAGLACG